MSGFDVKFLSFLMAQSHQFSFEEEEEKSREAKVGEGKPYPLFSFLCCGLKMKYFR